MSKKSFAIASAILGFAALIGAVSVFAAGNPPSIPPPFRPAPAPVQYALTLTQNGVSQTIDLQSWNWGLKSGTPPTFSSFSFTAESSALSPLLMLAAAQGTQFTSAVLTVTQNGVTSTVEMEGARLLSYDMGGSFANGTAQAPSDSGSLSFTKIIVTNGGNSATWDVTSGSTGGTVGSVGWDLSTNKAS